MELMVTIAVMGTGFAALLSAFAVIELQVRSTSDDAQLTVLSRLVSGVIEAQPAQGGISYIDACTGSGTYQVELAGNPSVITANPSNTYKISIVHVAQAMSTGGTTISPRSSCGSVHDYGVQQITFTVSYNVASPNNSVTRVVYKRWN